MPLFLSSGDVLADRRFDFARELLARGEAAAAAELLLQAVELAPHFASAWFALGEIRADRLDDRPGAIDAWRRARAADPADRHGAGLRLMRLGALELGAMTPAYVTSLFDQYAPRFEAALLGELGYRGPELLCDAVLDVCGAGRPPRFGQVIDLGCGTGLVGRLFRPLAAALVGIDLSAQMLAQARRSGAYARLVRADLVEGLAAESPAGTDLILAADVLIYIRDAAPLLCQAARVLKPGGLLAVTAETHAGDGVALTEGLRFAQSEACLRDELQRAGLEVALLQHASARTEHQAPLPGLVVVATRP
ncbi:methyltransferase domain-containing protein [Rhodopseudomonas palustris]|uniref:class I SAM-dependent DNA methyltransferase n=1 Tax=Rhodopseudomonas palustris TaxID=1076 RepID=UPI0020CC13FC|nr:methyltransferase domain-containing protein [Rhodopseudomonas palustris]MCP9628130.1 methyltransferase domain-containing protein [Rhodopseudomonas palustris]